MKNVIFDVDDTLYDLMEAFDKVHKEFFEDKTKEDCEELFKRSRIYSDEAFYMAREGKISHDDEFAYRIQKTYKDSGIEVSKEEAKQFEERYRYHQKHIHVPDGIKALLSECKKQGKTMGLLTNGTVRHQGKKLKTLGLSQWFDKDEMVISDAIGYTKPNIKASQIVQDKMNLIPEETWFVGDTFEVDVVGAKKAGWHVIWFNHRKRPMPEGDIRPDLEVRTVEELMDVITK